jgi:SAM-dependent methyltransferase
MSLRERVKWWLFPGFNLHARLRWRVLPRFFGTASPGVERHVLDAGCGNGMLSYRSCLRGNRVVGISIKEGEVGRCRKLFNEFLGIGEDRLSFRVHNIYDVAGLGQSFDEIICTEVLEHLARDEEVCRSFWKVLKPGGVLHLCSPNAEHPDNAAHECDHDEAGGHVRSGYTLESFRALLEPIGFTVEETIGLGGPVRQAFNRRIILVQASLGPLAGTPLFLAALPFLWMDPKVPRVPYSVYVRAVKRGTPASSNA